mgnify:CR=1 FL=1
MINLYILQFNNYYNRTIRKYETIEEYRRYVLEVIPNINNFDFGDGINTSHIFPYKGKSTPDYALITEEDESGNEIIKSRWFVIESTFIRGNKFEIQLRRDLIADNLDDVLDAPCMVEKGFVNNPLSDYSVFNSEGQNYNQIKQDETPLYDQTKCPWIVGYFIPPKDAGDYILKPTNIEITSEKYADTSLTSASQFKGWEYFENNPNKIDYNYVINIDDIYLSLLWDDRQYNEEKYMHYYNVSGTYNYTKAYAMGLKYTGNKLTGWDYNPYYRYFITDVLGYVGQETNDKFFDSDTHYNIYYKIKSKISEIFPKLLINQLVPNYTPRELLDYYNNKTFFIDEKYYKVSVTLIPDSLIEVPISLAQSNYIMENLGDYYEHTSGELAANVCKVSAIGYKCKIEYYEVKQYVNVAIEKNQYIQLKDAPYGMFCLPYSDKLKVYDVSATDPIYTSDKDINLQVATRLSALLGDGVIKDLQLLPYCPLQQNIITDISEPSFSSLYVSKSYIKSGQVTNETQSGDTIGQIFWCDVSNFKLDIPYTLNIRNYKEESELDSYRLCSPGYKSVFEFNAAKNGGINGFHVDATYKPYNPFILIHPNFGVLYKKNYEDNRGLICTDDFSLPIISDQWATYELNNKNYANTFYREIESMKLENKYSHYNDISNMISGTIQGTGSGMLSGMLAGGPTGAAVGGTIGGLSSLSAGFADIILNKKLRNDQIDKAEALFKYNLENIKARPQTVSKSSPININNKYVPFLEMYSCSEEEKNAFRSKIKYTGMTILRTSTLRTYLNYSEDATESYIRGSIIRFPLLGEDFHYLKELSNEVGQGFYLGRENY